MDGNEEGDVAKELEELQKEMAQNAQLGGRSFGDYLSAPGMNPFGAMPTTKEQALKMLKDAKKALAAMKLQRIQNQLKILRHHAMSIATGIEAGNKFGLTPETVRKRSIEIAREIMGACGQPAPSREELEAAQEKAGAKPSDWNDGPQFPFGGC